MTSLKKILVPVDFSEGSRAALDLAAFLADKVDATVDVVHVFEPATYFPALPGPGEAALGQYANVALETSKLELERFVDPVRRANVRRFGQLHLEVGFPMQQIVELAETQHADLIVMGTHGRRGFARLLLGSVASEVIRRAPCPVLTVRDMGEVATETAGAVNERRQ